MELIADFHVHSLYSRATSKQSNLEGLYKWAKIKGIQVVGTGDFTHPVWFSEMREKLVEAEPGLFTLKASVAQKIDRSLPKIFQDHSVRFVLSSEISCIYKKADKVRKVHSVILAPSFMAVSKINLELNQIGNLKADGRPILGLDCEKLLKIVLKADKNCFYFPAHIWTPWFSLFGSKSGFDSIQEAYGDLSGEIRAVETGLSSDPFMNWRLKQLENITLLSNSDAHSPQKLGREANIFNCQLDYFELIEAIKMRDKRFVGTIEFFPEEGKYHFDGHRSCNICTNPEQTKKLKGICPKCGKPLVIGVQNRVDEIADYSAEYQPKEHKRVEYIIPLPEILAEINHVSSSSSSKVQSEYEKIYSLFGSEFDVLRKLETEKLAQQGFKVLAIALEKLRTRKIIIKPGYDGVFGVIKVFGSEEEEKKELGQEKLF